MVAGLRYQLIKNMSENKRCLLSERRFSLLGSSMPDNLHLLKASAQRELHGLHQFFIRPPDESRDPEPLPRILYGMGEKEKE
jgi:hypothetical protein